MLGTLLAVTVAVILGATSVRADVGSAARCDHALCHERSASSVPDEGDGQAAWDSCVPGHTCGVVHGPAGLPFAALAVFVAATTPGWRTVRRLVLSSWTPPRALIVGGIERPPRFSH